MIQITPDLALDESEIEYKFIRSSGPGGQNINKVSTAVQLRWNLGSSSCLPDHVRRRLIRLAGSRVSKEGVLIIEARRFRTRERNRRDALHRLVELIRKAAQKRKIRHSTKPTGAAKKRRLESKRRRSEIKRLRRTVNPCEQA